MSYPLPSTIYLVATPFSYPLALLRARAHSLPCLLLRIFRPFGPFLSSFYSIPLVFTSHLTLFPVLFWLSLVLPLLSHPGMHQRVPPSLGHRPPDRQHVTGTLKCVLSPCFVSFSVTRLTFCFVHVSCLLLHTTFALMFRPSQVSRAM